MMNLTNILQPAPAPSADDLAPAPRAEEAKSSREFEKVFEKTTAEEEKKAEKSEPRDKPEDSKKQAKKEKNLPKIALNLKGTKADSQQKRAEELTGFGHSQPQAQAPVVVRQKQSAPANQSKVTKQTEKAGGEQAVEVKADLAQTQDKRVKPQVDQRESAKGKTESAEKSQKEVSNEQAARQALALKQARARQATRAQAKAEARAEAKAELKESDEAKAAQLRARNAPVKGAAVKPGNPAMNAPKTAEPEGKPGNGTQFAVNGSNMVMQAKQSSPSQGERPALVEELRPATSADVSPQSGGQSQQQDLPREQAKEPLQSIAPVSSAALPAATGTGAAQAFAPTAGIITPLMEKIWQSVSTFRARGGDEVTVKIQPDNRTELALTIKYGKGGVEIQARMQQGDGQQLQAGWSELQQALSERGVNLSELSRGENGEKDFTENGRNSHKNGENGSENDGFGFIDEDAEWAALGLDPNGEREEPEPVRREKALPAHDGWQSWA